MAAVGAPIAAADRASVPAPEVLWRAYPLDQRSHDGTPPRPAIHRRSAEAPPSLTEAAPMGAPSWMAWLAAAGSGAVLVLAALAFRREVLSDLTGAPTADAGRRALAPPLRRRPVGRRARAVCRIRWDSEASCFHAVTVEADGMERRVARSPRFDASGPSPPERSPIAHAALAQLASDLRTQGWRPLRTKGADVDEAQWYAQRFRRAAARRKGA